jgi:hypothetical protein
VTEPSSPDQQALSSSSSLSEPASLGRWPSARTLLFLVIATVLCLLPFSAKPFHVDDPLFVWTAQHIAHHPLDPYGFRVNWYGTESPIADITKNPPLASYYLAAVGNLFGWSERALHLALLLPPLAVVLGTYKLARRFTKFPIFAAAAVLFSPGFLVSSTTVMCDVLLLTFWIFAVIFWIEGLESRKPILLLAGALFVAAAALTKYFGIALFPLLLVYTILKRRRLDFAMAYLALPAVLLAAYQLWTRGLYGRGLLSDAVQYASLHNRGHELPLVAKTLVGLSFAGGCFLPALLLAPLVWRRMFLFAGAAFALIIGLVVAGHQGWFDGSNARAHWSLISAEMAVFVVGGVSAIALAFAVIRRPSADELLLVLWVAGTFLFAAFFNWTINARSILPMIPAASILLARRLQPTGRLAASRFPIAAVAGLLACGAVSLWVARADVNLANVSRDAATQLYQQHAKETAGLYFEGHWGFQYYMEKLGGHPADLRTTPFRAGDIVIIPENATNTFGPPPGFTLTGTIATFEVPSSLAAMSQPLGAGFYASVWGPLPFAIGPVLPERYMIARLVPLPGNTTAVPMILKP